MRRAHFRRILSGGMAMAILLSMIVAPGTATASAAAQKPPSNMGPFPIETETVTYKNGEGKDVTYTRSVRDPNIAPEKKLAISSDNDYLVRAFNQSMEYTYQELVVGPRQFPMDETDKRVSKHYEGVGPYTSTAVPSIWGTYHGFPGGGYRECFCDRDVSHTAEACSILSLNEENYAMLERFAEESVELWWRETSHGLSDQGQYNPDAVWGTEKKDAMKWFPLWSQDFYGDAYYMDASFRELPAPFEVLDKVWTQYRWTGDERWISDTMLNYGYRIHAEEDGLMDWYDYDGDGLVDNVRDYGWAPTLYEYEDASEMQNGQVTMKSVDQTTGDGEYKYETQVTIEPDFFQKHDGAFYQLPIDAKIIGDDVKENGVSVGNIGEQVFILNNKDKAISDMEMPALLRNYDRLDSSRNKIRDVKIPLYTPNGISFQIYEGRHQLRKGIDYTVDTTTANYPVVTLKKEFFSNNAYGATYTDKKINLGIVTHFYKGSEEISRATTELCLNTGNVIPEKDRMQLQKIEMTVGGSTTDITADCKAGADPNTGVIYLDYYSNQDTSYTLTVRHRTPITPRMTQGSRPAALKEYFKVTSDLVRVLVAGDTIGCQYQALRGMADMIEARIALGKTDLEIYHYVKGEKVTDKHITLTQALADEYDAKADAVQQQVWKEWVNPKWGYARAVNRMGELDTGWGHENSFFMPAKELLAPGVPTQKYLNFIQMNALLGTALNEEALTYMPEAFYMSGQNVSGWQWSQVSMNRLDPEQRDENQVMSTYPEIAMINIYNTINLMMGVEPGAATNAVSTLPRLTPDVGWVQVENIPLNQSGRDSLGTNMPDGKGGTYYGLDSAGNPRDIGFSKPKVGTLYTVKQDGTHTTTFTNQGKDGAGNGGDTVKWTAQFYSVDNQNDMAGYDKLYITKNGVQTEITGDAIKHTTIPPYTTYTELTVAPGETVTVSTRADSTKPAPNTKGELYLSDFDWAFASYPQSGSNGTITGAPKKDMGYAGTTLYESSFLSSYAKGLGTKVSDAQGTTLRYFIPGNATGFTAKAILTDFPRTDKFEVEAGATNAVRDFRVYVDGVEQGDTVTVGENGDLSAKDITVNFSFPDDGKIHTLDLVTSKNPGSGSDGSVGAAWADAKIAVPAGTNELPAAIGERNMYLSDLAPKTTSGKVVMDGAAGDRSKPMTMGGRAFAKGVSMQGTGSVTFELGGIYKSLVLTLGQQDGQSVNGNLTAHLNADHGVFTVTPGELSNGTVTREVDLSVNGGYADSITLTYAGNGGVANFADCILTLDDSADLADPAVIAKRILTAPDAKLGDTVYPFPVIPAPEPDKYTISVAVSDSAVLGSDGTLTPDTATDSLGTEVQVSFRITEKGGAARTADTKSFAVYVPAAERLPLDRLKWLTAGSTARVNTDGNGNKLKVDGETYETGIGLRANNGGESVTYLLDKNGQGAERYQRFTALAGYAQNSGSGERDLFRMELKGVKTVEGKEVFETLHATPVIGRGAQDENKHLANCASCQQAILQYGYATSDPVDVDLAGYEKLVITCINVGDSSDGNCAVVDGFLHKTSPFAGKTVTALAPVIINTTAGKKPALPAQVSATYEGVDAPRKLPVAWDWSTVTSGDYDQIGDTFTIKGAVKGTDKGAVCRVTVVNKIPLTVKSAILEQVKVYTPAKLPETVTVTYSDNTTGEERVTWENVPAGGWTKPGTYRVYGSLTGSALKSVCIVPVYDPDEFKMATAAPEKIDASNGSGVNETFKLMGNGVEYPNSIFAHANSEVIYNLDALGGGFTRFITDIGSRADSPNTSFIVSGYGIKGGKETLLFKTNMVTGLSDSLGDSSGYRYVDRDTVYGVDVNVTGYEKLKLVADTAGTPDSDHCIYGTPRLYTAGSRVGQDLHTVTVSAGAGGAIWPNGKVAVQSGEDITFTIKPNPANPGKNMKQMGISTIQVGDTLLSVKNDLKKNADGTYTYTMKNVVKDTAMDATFSAYELENLVPSLAAGNGKITIGEMPAAPGFSYYFKHTTATDAANKPALDSDFTAGDVWTLLDGTRTVNCPNGSTYYFQVVKVCDGQVKGWGEAHATPDATLFTVTVTGGVIGDKTGNVTVKSFHTGESVTVTVKTPGGKQFANWTAEGVTLTDPNAQSVTFSMPGSDVELTAVFSNIINIPLATMEPVSKNTPNGWEIDQTKEFVDGKSYEHSIWAHAPSTAIFELGGGYTRFTTKVGTSGGSDATSFIGRAYGVAANGEETLLYETNMVTKLGVAGDANGNNNGADEKGYYYVTNQGSAMCDVDVDVTGYRQLKLVMDEGMTPNADHAAYATPMLYTEHDTDQGAGFHTVTVTAGAGGAVWPNGKVAVDDAGTLTLTIQPAPDNSTNVSAATGGYLNAVLIDGRSVAVKLNGHGAYTLTLADVTANHTVDVSFTDVKPVLTPTLVAGNGKIRLSALPSDDAAAYYYKCGVDEVSEPAIDSAFDPAGWTAFAADTDITGLTNGTSYHVQVVKAADVDGAKYVRAWGSASATPAESVYILTVTGGSIDVPAGSYHEGDQVAITAATPDEGKYFAGWMTSGGGSFADQKAEKTVFTMPAADVTVTAKFEDIPTLVDLTEKIALTAGNNAVTLGNITPEDGETYYFQSSAEAGIKPAWGDFDSEGWTALQGTQTIPGTNGERLFVRVLQVTDGKITGWGEASATPAATTYPVTVTGGTADVEAGVPGTTVTVTAAAAADGEHFTGWTAEPAVAFADAAAEETTFAMPAFAVAITANFAEIPDVEDVTVVLTPGDGTLTVGGLTAAAGEAYWYQYTEERETKPEWGDFDAAGWTALPNTGAVIEELTNGTTYYVQIAKIDAANNLVAWGQAEETPAAPPAGQYAVTVNSGTVQGGSHQTEGSTVTITANDVTGKSFALWTTEDADVTFEDEGAATTTFVMPGHAVTVTATYDDMEYTLTVIGGTGSGKYAAGDEVTAVATPQQGQSFVKWEAEGVVLGNETSDEVTFLMPAGNVTLTATFEQTSVEGVTLNKSVLILYTTSAPTGQLTATVTPEDAVNKNVTWISDNERVATVNQNGLVTAVGVGVATITVTTEDGGFTAGCSVAVSDDTPPATGGGGGSSKTERHPDGSTTTTTTDKKTGAITAVTKHPDGKVVKVVTEKNGTVTNTVTDPEGIITETILDLTGKIVKTVAMPEGEKIVTVRESTGDKTITSFNKDGATLAAVVIPARVPAPEKPFRDMETYGWAKNAVDYSVGLGLLTGTGKDSFSAGMDMSRGMLITSLHRLSGKVDGGESAFDDVESGAWYADAVAWASKAGVITGANGKVNPDDAISRESLAVMLYRYAALLGQNTEVEGADMEKFDDAANVSDWAQDAMTWAVNNGILTGKGGKTLGPAGTATRGEAAVMLQRFVDGLGK